MTPGPPLTQHHAALQATFFRAWPKKRGSFLMYGRSVHTQRREVTEALRMQQPMETAADKTGAARPQRSGFMKSLAQALPPEPKAAERPAKGPVKVGLRQLRQKYEQQEPISMVTAYDYPSARLGDAAGADMLLVGDSVGMVVLGQEDTTEVTMETMVHHLAASNPSPGPGPNPSPSPSPHPHPNPNPESSLA